MQLLQVKDGKIVGHKGKPVQLRGTCIGGWMNMEDFINGYPGVTHTLIRTAEDILGPDRTALLFDRMISHFLQKEDIAFIKKCGASVVRLPLNYRHLEDNAHPFSYQEEGFERVKGIVDICAKHEIYTILDLHAVQGWQNTDWHSDNANRISLFWDNPYFQDRFVALWQEIAKRYKENPAVAGYNVMNEPVVNTPNGRLSFDYIKKWDPINKVYKRVVGAIREIDPDHIIFLEGDNYSTLFDGLDVPFAENLVYSSHNYNFAGFGPGSYPGTIKGEKWDLNKQEQVFLNSEGARFAEKHNVPLWVGEFGAVYNGPENETPFRLKALDDQISVYEKHGIHWTTWTYKDVGVMGWVMLNPESDYMQRIRHVLDAKKELKADLWMKWLPKTGIDRYLTGLANHIEKTVGDPLIKADKFIRCLMQATLSNFTSTLMQAPFIKIFKDLSEIQIDKVMKSFKFENCMKNQSLVDVVSKHMKEH